MEKLTLNSYSVPSQSKANIRYTVTLWEGDAHCNCPWGTRGGDSPIVCWHVRLVRALHYATQHINPLTDQIHREALTGRLDVQLYIIRWYLEILFERDDYARASTAALTLSKYLQALSFSGARPARLEEKEKEEETKGAPVGAPERERAVAISAIY